MIIKRKFQGRNKLRVWDENIHTNIYQVDNEKGPTEYNRELYWRKKSVISYRRKKKIEKG